MTSFFPSLYCSALIAMGIFQDDNVRSDWAQIVKELFSEDETSISHKDWPPLSSDLNTVENLWNLLHHQHRILAKKMMQLWEEINAVMLHKLIKMMPQ